MDSLVSIIIPTYRRSHIIKTAVSNCLSQTYPNTEVIIVDDNGVGTEEQLKTEEVIKQYFSEEEKVSYIKLPKNSGACFARNTGVEKSKGMYIAFYDDDDSWELKKVESQMKHLEQHPDCLLTVCAFKLIEKKGTREVRVRLPMENQYQYFLKNLDKNFGFPLTLVKKSAFLEAGGLDNSFKAVQDMDLNFRLLKLGKACFQDEVLMTVHAGEHARISSNYTNRIESYQKVLDKYQQILPIEGERFLKKRILYLSFALGDNRLFDKTYQWMSSKNLMKIQYHIMRHIRVIPFLKNGLVRYMGY